MTKPIALFITDTHLSEHSIETNFSVFEQAINKCLELGINTIFHGGDIFTSRKGQPEIVLNAFKFILDQAATKGINIIAIGGNHDKTDYTSESSYLDAFTSHPALNVMSPYGVIENEGLLIHFLPYYDEDLIYSEYLKLIEFPAQYKHVLITHVAINGIKNNGGTEVSNELGSDLFSKFDLVLVGHYHNRQILGNIVYTGSTHQANFGEDEYKGYTLIYSDASYEFGEFNTPKFITMELNAEDVNSGIVKKFKLAENNNRIRLRICGEYPESKQDLLLELQQSGIKVEKVKEDYAPIDVIQSETVQITSNDILHSYDEWAKENKIEKSEYGRKLIEKCL